jgi:hypothetical protein
MLSRVQFWFRSSGHPSRRPGVVRPRPPFQPKIDPLEDRTVPTVFHANSLGDLSLASGVDPATGAIIGTNGVVTLRSAVQAANLTHGGNTIQIDVTGTLILGGGLTLSGNIDVEGPGADKLTIKSLPGVVVGSGLFSVFEVSPGATAIIDGLTLTGIPLPKPGPADGGAIDNFGTLTVSNCILTGNAVGGKGGAIYNSGNLTVNRCLLSDNTAHEGGGIYNDGGTLAVEQSTLMDNSAEDQPGLLPDPSTDGGGLEAFGGLVTISNSTIYGNTAYRGGGIEADGGVKLALVNSTVTNNEATQENAGFPIFLPGIEAVGGGIDALQNNGGTVLLYNSIVAENVSINSVPGNPNPTNTTPDDIDGSVDPSSSYNLIGDGDNTGLINGVQGNQVGTQNHPLVPLLGPLQDNGGPTQTRAPLPGSPALGRGGPTSALISPLRDQLTSNLQVVNAAVFASNETIQIDGEQMLVTAVDTKNNTLTVQRGVNGTQAAPHAAGAAIFFATDQRGLPRLVNGQEDIGAFQTQAPAPPPAVAAAPPLAAPAEVDVVVPFLVRQHGRLLVVGVDVATGLEVFEMLLPRDARNVRTSWQVAADGSLEPVVLFRSGHQQHEWLFSSNGVFLGDLG